MPQRLLFVVNPNSGKGEMRHHIVECVDAFIRAGFEVTLYTTQLSGDASRIVNERGSEFDRIVCSGGDGTLNETVAGIMSLNERPAIGYIPSGTTNDFANGLLIPKKHIDATNLIINGMPFSIDIGQFNEKYFTYVAGFGAFTEVSYSTPQAAKHTFGRMAYILESIKSLSSMRSYDVIVETENQTINDTFIFGMVTNATSVGGFKNIVGDDVSLNDGFFEVFLVKSPTNPIELQITLNELFSGDVKSQFITKFKAKYVNFICNEEIPWTLDGEFGGAPKKVKIINHQKALSIFTGHL